MWYRFSETTTKEPWQMTKHEFVGKPRITPKSNAALLRPYLGKSAQSIKPESFMNGRYTIKRGVGDYSTFTVLDGDIPIACYDGSTLVVDKKYRRQGIASELVYDFRTHNPHVLPTDTRTKAAHEIQEKVHRRIVLEALAEGKPVPDEVMKDYPDLKYQKELRNVV